MNLSYVHKLLLAADQQRHGFLKIRGRQADREVRLMAEAGLVDATLSDDKDESFTAINRLTDLGRKFLRTFKDPTILASVLVPPTTRTAAKWQSKVLRALPEKWKMKFASGLRRPEQAD